MSVSLRLTLTLRRTLLAIFSSAALLGLAYGCSASNDYGSGQLGGSGSGGIGEAGLDEVLLGSDAKQGGDGSLQLNPLCGASPNCVPDDFLACADYVAPALSTGAAGEGGQSSSKSGADRSTNGSAGEGGASGSSAEAGAGGAVQQVLPTIFGCQVQRTAGPAPSAVAACAVVGPGGSDAPCLTSSDCQAGYGCVGDPSAGLCERYCCQDANACEADTYCTPRPMRDAATNTQGSEASALLIPVCVPAENCDLSVAYPCASGAQCTCKSGTACMVVRSDGTTTCAVPGAGKAGDACPCAWGNVCSAATNQCLKLCATRGAQSCGDGKCQSATELPDGWGVCVGG